MGESSKQIQPTVPQEVRPLTNKLTELAGNSGTPIQPYRMGASGSQSPYGQFTGGESNALNYLRSQTYGGNPMTSRSNSALMDTIGGRYLNPSSNPYLSDTADIISEKSKRGFGDMMGLIDSRSNMGGNLFSTANNTAKRDASRDFSENLTNSLTSLYGGNYNMERGNQMNAIGMGQANIPGQNQFNNSMSLLGAEGIPRGVANQSGQFDYSDFLRQGDESRYQNQLPFNQYMQLLSGYPLGYDQYTPGRSPYQDASSIIGPLSMLLSKSGSSGFY